MSNPQQFVTVNNTNASNGQTIDVCLCTWGDQSGAYESIAPGKSYAFNRWDPRGFVMVVRNGSSGAAQPYYVTSPTTINASSATSVSGEGIQLQSLTYPMAVASKAAAQH